MPNKNLEATKDKCAATLKNQSYNLQLSEITLGLALGSRDYGKNHDVLPDSAMIIMLT